MNTQTVIVIAGIAIIIVGILAHWFWKIIVGIGIIILILGIINYFFMWIH